jgi:IPT/TIG domain
MRMWLGFVLLPIAQVTAGCSSSMPASTVAPTVVAAPSVTSIFPDVGSISGATTVKIAGTNLGTTVTFGGVPAQGRFFAGNPTMYLSAPAHAPGTVDIVVSGHGGQLVKLTDAYTYVSPLTFDFNGDWASYGETVSSPLSATMTSASLAGSSRSLTRSVPSSLGSANPTRGTAGSNRAIVVRDGRPNIRCVCMPDGVPGSASRSG